MVNMQPRKRYEHDRIAKAMIPAITYVLLQIEVCAERLPYAKPLLA